VQYKSMRHSQCSTRALSVPARQLAATAWQLRTPSRCTTRENITPAHVRGMMSDTCSKRWTPLLR